MKSSLLGRPSKHSMPLLLRRIEGNSMLPTLPAGKLIIASKWFRRLRPGDVVILRHLGVEKIKQIQDMNDDQIFVVGLNAAASTDSRQFGWINRELVIAKVIT